MGRRYHQNHGSNQNPIGLCETDANGISREASETKKTVGDETTIIDNILVIIIFNYYLFTIVNIIYNNFIISNQIEGYNKYTAYTYVCL